METAQQSGPRPGWYPDPHDAAHLRWWTGSSWTDYTTLAPRAPHLGRARPRKRRSPLMGLAVSLLAVAMIVGAMSFSSQYLTTPAGVAGVSAPGGGELPAAPPANEPTAATDLSQAIAGSVVVQADCGAGCAMVGGGTAVAPDVVLTAEHVVGDSTGTIIIDAEGEAHAAVVVDRDPVRDLALLRAPTLDVPIVQLRSEPAPIGLPVHAVGAPGGERRVTEGTVTDILDLGSDGVTEIQTDADIDQGNSGGPLLDDQGRLVGVVVSEHEFDDAVGWATSAADAADFLAVADDSPGAGSLQYFGGQGAQDELREMIESFLNGWGAAQ